MRLKMRNCTQLAHSKNPAKSAMLAGRRKGTKMPTFCTHVPYFSPFFPPKWENPQNRSLRGGTGRARRRKKYQPSRGIKRTCGRRHHHQFVFAGKNINPVAGLKGPNRCNDDSTAHRRKKYQPSRGIKRIPPPRLTITRFRAGKNINPVAGLKEIRIAHFGRGFTEPEKISTQSRD